MKLESDMIRIKRRAASVFIPHPSSLILRRSGGFTLLEAMLAVVILGAAMLAIMEGLSHSLNAIESIKNYNTATELLGMKLAEVDQLTVLEEGVEDGDFEEYHPGFTWIREIVASELTDLYEVRITVNWTEHGTAASDSIATYLFRASDAPRKLGDATKKVGERNTSR
jgi:type II secretory pathway pseudopilin PulG